MTIQFTTDGSPAYRRLALWQDIVCDVYVGLDCHLDIDGPWVIELLQGHWDAFRRSPRSQYRRSRRRKDGERHPHTQCYSQPDHQEERGRLRVTNPDQRV